MPLFIKTKRIKKVETNSTFFKKLFRYSPNYFFPNVATITALIVCILFSASSKTTEFGLLNTSSSTSRTSIPCSYFSLASVVSNHEKMVNNA